MQNPKSKISKYKMQANIISDVIKLTQYVAATKENALRNA